MRPQRFAVRHRLTAALLLILGTPSVALAASEPTDVVITARRDRGTDAPRPGATLTVDADDLRTRGDTNARDIAASVPNLVWLGTDGTSVSNLFLRGVGAASIHSNQTPSVAIVVDDVTQNSAALSSFPLFDLERVEVERGPPISAYGRPTTAGAVRFISARPTLVQGLSARGSVTGGSQQRFDVEAAVSIPLTKHWAARVSAIRLSRGDLIDNLTRQRGEAASERFAGRAQLLWQPSDRFTGLVSLHGGRFDGSSVRYKQIGLSDPLAPGRSDCPRLAVDLAPGNGCSDQTGFQDTRSFTQNFSGEPNLHEQNTSGGLLRLSWIRGNLETTSLTAYERASSDRAEDTDGGPSFVFASYQTVRAQQWSQEFRVAFSGPARLSWDAGLYLFEERGDFLSVRRNPNILLSDILRPGVAIPEQGVRTSLLFGDLEQQDQVGSAHAGLLFSWSPRTRIGADLRITRERKSGLLRAGALTDSAPVYSAAQFLGPTQIDALLTNAVKIGAGPLLRQCPAPFATTQCYVDNAFDASWTHASGRLYFETALRDRWLLRASAAHASKAGTLSPIAPESIRGVGGRLVRPESLWSYSVGVAGSTADDSLQVDTTLFLNDWDDYQLFLSEPTPVGTAVVLTNLPRSRTHGLEALVTWTPDPAWELRTALGITRSEVLDRGAISNAIEGAPLLATPQITFNQRVRRRWNGRRGGTYVQVEGSFVDEREFSLNRLQRLAEPGYWLFDAAAGWRFGTRERQEISLWARNLTGTRYCVRRAPNTGLGSGDTVTCLPNEGRPVFGISLRASFE